MIDELKILKDLNEKQKEAVLYTDGPLLIGAGAGSGKTRTLTHKVAYFLAIGIKPENILALTFTNKAAEEMKERIKNLLGEENFSQKLFIGTFHKLGVIILKDLLKLVQRQNNFVIFDEEDSLKLIKDCLKELNLPKEQFIPTNVRNEISRAKNELIFFTDYELMADNFFQAFDVIWHRLKGNNRRIFMGSGQMHRHYTYVGTDIQNKAAIGHHIPEIDKISFFFVPFQ